MHELPRQAGHNVCRRHPTVANSRERCLNLLLVTLSSGGVLRLLSLITKSVFGGTSAAVRISRRKINVETVCSDIPSTERCVAILGNLLVGLLGGTGSGLLDLVGDEVGTLLDGVHDVGWLI